MTEDGWFWEFYPVIGGEHGGGNNLILRTHLTVRKVGKYSLAMCVGKGKNKFSGAYRKFYSIIFGSAMNNTVISY